MRLGIRQDVWNLFAPDPDFVNTRLKAEITYRDLVRDVWLDDWDRPPPLLPAAVSIEIDSVPPIPPLVVSLPGRPRR